MSSIFLRKAPEPLRVSSDFNTYIPPLPVEKGGSAGREEATGRGGIYVLKSLLEKIKTESAVPTVAIQGFGNLGFHFARIAHEEGYKVVAISDSKHAIYVPAEINPLKTKKYREKNGTHTK